MHHCLIVEVAWGVRGAQVWCEGKGVTSRWRLSPGEVPRGTQDGRPVSITYSDLWRSLVVCWASGKVDVLSIKG